MCTKKTVLIRLGKTMMLWNKESDTLSSSGTCK
jgi:hypothetical protein